MRRQWIQRAGGVAVVVVILAAGAYYVTAPWRAAWSTNVGAETPSIQRFQQRIRAGAMAGSNFLLITWDTVRADRVGCYGYAGAETPTLDGLAARGVQFDHAVTGVPSTLPSHATMLTGLESPNHGARTNGKFVLGEENVTLAEVLRAHGYATSAFVATYVLHARFGTNQGFDTYDDTIPPEDGRRADHITDAAIKWLGNQRASRPAQPFFMWVHYFDAHRQDTAPSPFAERFADRPYDGQIAFVDHEMRRLLAFLEVEDLTEHTLIMVASDHGEGLGDHLENTHSRLIYDSTIRIPWVISCPAFYDEPLRVDDVTVGTIDFMPTALSLLGIKPPAAMDGLDLVTAKVPADRAMYLETLDPFLYHGWAPLHGIRRIDAKYITAPLPEYYDLIDDPGELRNLLKERPGIADELAAILQARMADWPSAGEAATQVVRQDRRMVEQLASLGYVSTASIEQVDPSMLADPKDMVPIWRELSRNDPKELHRLSVELLERPDADEGAIRRAVILAEAAYSHAPESPEYLRVLGAAQFRAGEFKNAAMTLTHLERIADRSGLTVPAEAMAMLARAKERLKQMD